MKVQYFIGIDISAETLDFCLLDNSIVLERYTIKNNKKALRKLFKQLNSDGISCDKSWICAEHTGSYGYKLRLIIEEFGYKYSMVPAIEIMKSIGLTRGKNDKIDAQRIADYASRFNDKLRESRLPEKHLIRLKNLFTYRNQRVRNATRLKNQLKQLQTQLECSPRDYMIVNAKKELRQCQKVVKEIERQIQVLINEDENTKTNYNLAKSVLGVGPMTACYMLICTNNFELFENSRKFASYGGLAPYEHKSGSSIKGKTKTSKLRDKKVKALLLNGVNSVISGKNEFASYYNRKLNEGKHKNSVKNAVAFKIMNRIFAVVKRGTPYVATYSGNF